MTTWDGREYQARIEALAATGQDLHGEAALVRSFSPRSVLDAGCGTGRVAIELARHGIDVVGVDLDHSMLEEARRLAPELSWIEADLAELDLIRSFDVVLLAGNIPIFCEVESRDALVHRCAAHLMPGGLLIAGFQLGRGYELDQFDRAAAVSELTLEARWSTWGGEAFESGSEYAVSILRSQFAECLA